VRLVEQLKALLNMPHWFTQLAMDKNFYGRELTEPGLGYILFEYAVPEGRRLYVSDYGWGTEVKARLPLHTHEGVVAVFTSPAYGSVVSNMHKPVRVEAGGYFQLRGGNVDTVSGYIYGSAWAWETPASPEVEAPRVETASEAFKRGVFNTAVFKPAVNGVREVRVSGVDLRRTYSFRVRNLYRDDEEILEDEPVEMVKFPRRLV